MARFDAPEVAAFRQEPAQRELFDSIISNEFTAHADFLTIGNHGAFLNKDLVCVDGVYELSLYRSSEAPEGCIRVDSFSGGQELGASRMYVTGETNEPPFKVLGVDDYIDDPMAVVETEVSLKTYLEIGVEWGERFDAKIKSGELPTHSVGTDELMYLAEILELAEPAVASYYHLNACLRDRHTSPGLEPLESRQGAELFIDVVRRHAKDGQLDMHVCNQQGQELFVRSYEQPVQAATESAATQQNLKTQLELLLTRAVTSESMSEYSRIPWREGTGPPTRQYQKLLYVVQEAEAADGTYDQLILYPYHGLLDADEQAVCTLYGRPVRCNVKEAERINHFLRRPVINRADVGLDP